MNRHFTNIVLIVCCVVLSSCNNEEQFNDWKLNQLSGEVKEITTERIVHYEDNHVESEYEDPQWYWNSKWTTSFDTKGYITSSEDYKVTYDETHKQCIYSYENEDRTFYSQYTFTIDTISNGVKYDGKWKGTHGGGGCNMAYTFDEQFRLTEVSQYSESLFYHSMNSSNRRIFYYQGDEKQPFKMDDFLNYGGWGWNITLLIKYDETDAKGNWLKRKFYFLESMELFFEEIRSITYY